MFGPDFITDRMPLDLACLEELQGKMKAAELTDLKALLSEFNESLMVDQITQNETEAEQKDTSDTGEQDNKIGNVKSNYDNKDLQ